MTRGDKLRRANDIEIAANIVGCIAAFLVQSELIKEEEQREFMTGNIDSVIEWLQEESEEQHVYSINYFSGFISGLFNLLYVRSSRQRGRALRRRLRLYRRI